ncbi:MAG: hypothetical protein V3R85_01920 [Alphaproteobacteria bacterium]
MATVLAESDLNVTAPPPSRPVDNAEVVPFPTDDAAGTENDEAKALVSDAREGIKRLMAMSPDQLRALIADKVNMLENELEERDARRSALEEARAAQRMLDARRRRAKRIRHRVNVLSTMSVALFAGFMVISVF